MQVVGEILPTNCHKEKKVQGRKLLKWQITNLAPLLLSPLRTGGGGTQLQKIRMVPLRTSGHVVGRISTDYEV